MVARTLAAAWVSLLLAVAVAVAVHYAMTGAATHAAIVSGAAAFDAGWLLMICTNAGHR